ncbi:MAG: FAD-dependent oxidoreductase, partial [Cyanobacteria bacterium J06632_3]
MKTITADVLVVGGGAGGTAAAIQAARYGLHHGLKIVLVSDLPWLGGMLTAAGVSAPDGNELAAFQTGLWGAFLRALRSHHSEGLNHGWVSFFTYNPAVGAQIFADWVAELPNLEWICGEMPRAVLCDGKSLPAEARNLQSNQSKRITGVQFDTLTVQAKVTIDGTELGDLLALGDVPHRWGWETQDVWNEPSAPVSLSDPADPLYAITQRYPVQSPTWVVVMQDYGDIGAPKIELPASIESADDLTAKFGDAWANYGDSETPAGQMFLNYGRLPGDRFMINWPHHGNDYGVGLHRLVESAEARSQYGKEAQQHSQAFAHYIQQSLGERYGLASDIFPKTQHSPGGGFALMPYYRESRRLIGLETVTEGDILPVEGGQVAALPMDKAGRMSAITLGNYPNDHHYPGFEMPLAPKAILWGGRWTGTPFTIPYGALIPETVDGLLACEKNISVSHIANGATRLQPVVLGIGQAAGMAAAMCAVMDCDPRELDVRSLQTALVSDAIAPTAVVPLFNVSPDHPHWQFIQQKYIDGLFMKYPLSGYHPLTEENISEKTLFADVSNTISLQGE